MHTDVQFDCENCGAEIQEVQVLDEDSPPGTVPFTAVSLDADVVCGHCGTETGTTIEEVVSS